MEKQKIRNTLLGFLLISLLAGSAPDVLAQRTEIRSERRSDKKRPAPTRLKKEKILKQSGKKAVRKNRTSKSARSKARYSNNKNWKKVNLNSKNKWKSNKKDRKYTYKIRNRKRHSFPKTTWHRSQYRKPVWVDYYRPKYRYPKIGMHVSVLPHGFISLRIGKLRFYVHRGVYYHYNPDLQVYIVMNKPKIETRYTSETWDSITLVDGSTIEGLYLYSDNDIVYFEIGDALLEIPMSEIEILYLS